MQLRRSIFTKGCKIRKRIYPSLDSALQRARRLPKLPDVVRFTIDTMCNSPVRNTMQRIV